MGTLTAWFRGGWGQDPLRCPCVGGRGSGRDCRCVWTSIALSVSRVSGSRQACELDRLQFSCVQGPLAGPEKRKRTHTDTDRCSTRNTDL
eukprot:5744888-Pleurochrysis_carterae.AAC.1